MRHTTALVLSIAALAACSDSVTTQTGGTTSGSGGSSTSSTSTGATACVPGQQVACACVGGAQGAQACAADGECGSGGSGGGLACSPGVKKACYEGPAGTENIGTCKGGEATCKPDGSGYGPCAGQVLPQPDLCSTAADEDCNGSPTPCQEDVSWCHGYAANNNYVIGVGADAMGHVVFGLSAANVDFGSGPLNGTTLVKFDKTGSQLWARAFPISSEAAFGVAPDGTIVLAGTFQGTADLGTGLLACPASGTCPVIAKLAPDGTTTFAKALFGANASGGRPAKVLVNASGEIVITGTIPAGSAFDCGTGPITATSQDVFLAKLSANGNCLWSKGGGATSQATPSALATDAAGDLLLAGWMFGSLTFGGATITVPSGTGYFLAKLDATGAPLYAKAFPVGQSQQYVGAGMDSAGNAFLAGTFSGSTDFGGGPLTATAAGDVFVAKFDISGNHLWSKNYGSGSPEIANAVAVDPGGNAWVTGYFQNLTDLGAGSLKSAGADDVFLAKYGPDGAGLASHAYGDAQPQYGVYVTTNALGSPIVAGIFQGSLDVGSGPIMTGGLGAFVCQIGQ
jgi:hypothetical protein